MRRATTKDADSIAALDALLFPNRCFNEKTVADQLEEDRSWVIFAKYDILGYVIVVEDGVADLLRIGVHPEVQGEGLGTAMLEAVIEENGDLMLCVDKTNEGALKLYLKHGFEIVGEINKSWAMVRYAS